MSGATTLGATLTGAIPIIATLFPLLGSQQCEDHIGSALTKGYLYAATTPTSIFGSLGVARAGFKTLVACLCGHQFLANFAFEPKGSDLALIAIDEHDKQGRRLIEKRLDELLHGELHIDRSKVTVANTCTLWNVGLSALFSLLNMFPFLHLNFGSGLTISNHWAFPILRTIGGFLTALMMQVVVQKRVAKLATRYLAQLKLWNQINSTQKHKGGLGDRREAGATSRSMGKPLDVNNGSGFQHDATTNKRNGPLDWIHLILLLAGILAFFVGHVGCLGILRNTTSSTDRVRWLSVEICLAVFRLTVWGLNPNADQAPPLENIFTLGHHHLLPTCIQDHHHHRAGGVGDGTHFHVDEKKAAPPIAHNERTTWIDTPDDVHLIDTKPAAPHEAEYVGYRSL